MATLTATSPVSGVASDPATGGPDWRPLPAAAVAAVERLVGSGAFPDVAHVVQAAVASLERDLTDEDEALSDLGPGELSRLIEEGERSGPPVPAATVFAELRARGRTAASADVRAVER